MLSLGHPAWSVPAIRMFLTHHTIASFAAGGGRLLDSILRCGVAAVAGVDPVITLSGVLPPVPRTRSRADRERVIEIWLGG